MIVIIGGSSGVGKHLAEHYQARGKSVVVGARSIPSIIADRVKYITLDVRDEASVEAFFNNNNIGEIDALIYATGITAAKTSMEHFDKPAFLNVLDTNVAGFALAMKYAMKHMRAQGSRVVVFGSMASRSISLYSSFEYTASKSALASLVRHFAIEFARDNILVNCIHPGPIDTPMLRAHVAPDDIANITASIPTGKLTSLDDVAAAVDFLIGEGNTNVTGAAIDINGGQMLTA